MRDYFDWIDSWESKFNILRDFRYLRKVALIFALVMIPLWFILGFDSGVGIIEDAVKLLHSLLSGQIGFHEWVEASYETYGRSFHISSFTIYGLLFVAISYHLEKLGLVGTKNSIYSSLLSVFNIGVFELWYMASFAYFQMQRSLITWFTNDFLKSPIITNFWFLIVGGFIFLSFYADGFILKEKTIVWRLYRFKPNIKLLVVLSVCLVSIFFWVFYPFEVQTATIGDWASSQLFPQTHYAYKNDALYIQNDLLHLVNLITKTMFALSQIFIIRSFKK